MADLDRAEDQDLFEQALKELDIPQPPGQTILMKREAVEAAHGMASHVLVRPSYVLGSRYHEIVRKQKRIYALICGQPVKDQSDHPVWWILIGDECRSGCHF